MGDADMSNSQVLSTTRTFDKKVSRLINFDPPFTWNAEDSHFQKKVFRKRKLTVSEEKVL